MPLPATKHPPELAPIHHTSWVYGCHFMSWRDISSSRSSWEYSRTFQNGIQRSLTFVWCGSLLGFAHVCCEPPKHVFYSLYIMLMHFVARLYTNTQTGPEPPYGLCLTQASLLYGAMPMSTFVCLSLVYHVWTTVYVSKIDPEVAAPWHRLRLILVRFTSSHAFIWYYILILACLIATYDSVDNICDLGNWRCLDWVSRPFPHLQTQTVFLLFIRLWSIVSIFHISRSPNIWSPFVQFHSNKYLLHVDVISDIGFRKYV
jgi:hypothetical protein